MEVTTGTYIDGYFKNFQQWIEVEDMENLEEKGLVTSSFLDKIEEKELLFGGSLWLSEDSDTEEKLLGLDGVFSKGEEGSKFTKEDLEAFLKENKIKFEGKLVEVTNE